jgi:hypothetical protein
MKTKGTNHLFGAGISILIGILVFVLAGCESIFGPKSEEETTSEDEEARIVVTNYYQETLDIYMDGVFRFSLEDEETGKIRDVTLDEHDLEAKLTGTSTVVDSETVDVTAYSDYSWTIGDPPDINVINNYGVTLKIYMDNSYQFDIQDEENRWIMNVSFGEHFLKALKVSDNKEVASTTLNIKSNTDYTWTIE